MVQMKKAVVLSSGGLDSTTVMAIAKAGGFEIFSLSFQYGQRHSCELESAKKVAKSMEAKRHLVIKTDFTDIGGSALTADIEVPKGRDLSEMESKIPVTYVPARNTIFLSYALGWAEVLGCEDIFIGVNAIDYSGYPDCRPEFIQAFERMANLSTRAGVEATARGQTWMRIAAPLAGMSKAQIVRRGRELGVDFSLTISCYDPSPTGQPCGHCDACLLRARGMDEA